MSGDPTPTPSVATPVAPVVEPSVPTRDWAVSVFVIWREQVLLHRHRKLRLWLPPGGHVEFGELPDEAAVREVLEETGVAVELVGERAVEAPGPVQLVRPRGVQLDRHAGLLEDL